ncbi:MAG: alpha-L-arabinofuranosidase C-terminal domain-containing protein [Candidatus Zipacnadales bacterium]
MVRLCLLLVTVSGAPRGLAELVFEEPFETAQLADRWSWLVPVAGPTISLTERPGWLRLHAPAHPGGFNHWVGDYRAPLLSTAVPAGDWDAEAHLQLSEAGPEATFHVGLCVIFSPQHLLTLGPFRAPQFGAPQPEVWLEPTGRGAYRKAGAPAENLWVLFRKRGWQYEALLKRSDEADWTSVGTYSTVERPQGIGLLGKTFGDQSAVTLDVDYVRLTSVSPPTPSPPLAAATVRVDTGAPLTRLDPRYRGHFVELMHRCFYGGLWAEMLQNRKFTGEVAETGVIEGWEPLGAREGVRFARDNVIYYVPAQAQRIESPGGAECGILQRGIELAAGVGLEGRVVLRADPDRLPVVVSVRRGEELVASREFEVSTEWDTYEFAFTDLPTTGDLAALDSFAITTRKAGTLWVGCASLMPDDNLDGFRRDVIELCRKMQIPSLRYPGGNFASGYHWEDGLGPRDLRPPRWDRAWGEWEWNDVGTHEYFRLCELLGCEPYITVNAGEGTPAEAAAWVEYVNGSQATPQGKRRAANGHPEPFGCSLWSIGNEMYGNWQLGHLDATKYALRCVEFANLMRAVDPNLELIVNGVEGPNPWNVRQVEIAGHVMDYLSVHHYTGDDPARSPLENYSLIATMPLRLERMLRATFEELQQHTPPGKTIRLMFDEWNVWTRLANQQGYEDFYQLRDGIYAVGVLNALVRLAEVCPGAHLAQTVNVLGAIRTTKTKAVASPLALAFQLHAEHSGPWRAVTEVQTPRLPLPGVEGEIPLIDAVAMLSEDQKTLHLILLNRHPTEDLPCSLVLEGPFTPVRATQTLLTGPSFEAINTFETPDTVKLTTRDLEPGSWGKLTLPKHSAMAVTLLTEE